jgi:hypothetical protein
MGSSLEEHVNLQVEWSLEVDASLEAQHWQVPAVALLEVALLMGSSQQATPLMGSSLEEHVNLQVEWSLEVDAKVAFRGPGAFVVVVEIEPATVVEGYVVQQGHPPAYLLAILLADRPSSESQRPPSFGLLPGRRQ